MNKNERNLFEVYSKYKDVLFADDLYMSVEGHDLFEHKNDLKPIICIIIGGPGAGKTYWMQNDADSYLWQQFKQLDIDHTLQKYQLETCNEVAENLIASLSNYEVKVNKSLKRFEEYKDKIQRYLNEKTDKVGSFGMYIDISPIKIDSKIGKSSLWEWAKRMDKIQNDDKFEDFLKVFKREFYKTYFKSIFSRDFSKRDVASKDYDQSLYTKLGNDIINNNNSTCIAITGKSIDDINWIINSVKHTDSVISVVYIDVPVERAIKQDGMRDRTLGDNFVSETMKDVANTWEVLKNEFENKGIWKLFHITPKESSVRNKMIYKTSEVFTNKTMMYNK